MRLSGKRVVVTGGAGFIGSHLVDRLLAEDVTEVRVIDDFSSGSPVNLEHNRSDNRLSVFEADVRDEEEMMRLIAGSDSVLHLATLNVRLSLRRPTAVHEVNTTGTYNVLKASAAASVEKFLYCSSSEVNGTADTVPMKEEYTFRPETLYGASKLTGEYYTEVFQRSGWLRTVIARPHNNYGPREHYAGVSGEVIPRFIVWALAGKPPIVYGSGEQTRDFIYVTETADILVRLVQEERSEGQTFNVCRGKEVSVLQIIDAIGAALGSTLSPVMHPSRPNDVIRLFGDPGRLIALLGEGPKIDLVEGIKMTLEWFRENVTIDQALLESLESRNWEVMEAEPWMVAKE